MCVTTLLEQQTRIEDLKNRLNAEMEENREYHRLVAHVDDPLFRRIQSAASSRGYVTMQGFLESLLYKLEEEKENPHEV